MSVPARFLQDAAGSMLHRFADPGTPYATHNSGLASSPRTAPVKKSLLNGFASSPLNRPVRQSSPSKLVGNSSRRMSSPSRARNSVGASASLGDQPGRSSSGYGIDGQARRRWLGGSKVDGEHLLRVPCNRHVQWRCVNAQMDAALAQQKMTAELKARTIYFQIKITSRQKKVHLDQAVRAASRRPRSEGISRRRARPPAGEGSIR